MCVVSMVYDHYNPLIPQWPAPAPWIQPAPYEPSRTVPDVSIPTITVTPPGTITMTPEQLARLLREFHEAVEAAKKVDALTGQPDCVDPKKAELEVRVAALEAELAKLKKPKRAKKRKKTSSR